MSQPRVKLIVNPNADLGRAWRIASALQPLVAEYCQPDWTGTVFPRHAIELAHQAAIQGYDLVVAVGGDGTAHEVMNGLMQVPPTLRPKMGIIPLGSGNDFAFACGMSHDPFQAIRQVFTGNPKAIDIGLMIDDTGRRAYWDNTLGIGFDATTTIRSRKLTYLRGFLLYLAAVLQTIALNHTAPTLRIVTDQETWVEPTIMLTLCNGEREGGGFLVAPGARNNDAVLNYAMVRKVSRLTMLQILPAVMQGTHGRFKDVQLGRFSRLKLESDAGFTLHLDGEIYAGFTSTLRKLEIEILPAALTVVA
jgi:YegS/Rv2252/BmrU family lipid kinase